MSKITRANIPAAQTARERPASVVLNSFTADQNFEPLPYLFRIPRAPDEAPKAARAAAAEYTTSDASDFLYPRSDTRRRLSVSSHGPRPRKGHHDMSAAIEIVHQSEVRERRLIAELCSAERRECEHRCHAALHKIKEMGNIKLAELREREFYASAALANRSVMLETFSKLFQHAKVCEDDVVAVRHSARKSQIELAMRMVTEIESQVRDSIHQQYDIETEAVIRGISTTTELQLLRERSRAERLRMDRDERELLEVVSIHESANRSLLESAQRAALTKVESFMPKQCVHCGLPFRKSKLVQHEANCTYRPTFCPHCHQEMQYHDLVFHEKECRFRVSSCPKCSGLDPNPNALHSGECYNSLANCAHCQKELRRYALEAHEATCTKKRLQKDCVYCGEMIKFLHHGDYSSHMAECPSNPLNSVKIVVSPFNQPLASRRYRYTTAGTSPAHINFRHPVYTEYEIGEIERQILGRM